jgi:hypothetical protein
VTSDDALIQLLENQIAIMQALVWLVSDPECKSALCDLIIDTCGLIDGETSSEVHAP